MKRMFNEIEKYCPHCKQWKKHDEFYKNKARAGGLSCLCKICHKADPHFSIEVQRDYKRKFTYGITPEQYQEMWNSQKGKCAISFCGNPIECIDHDHNTNKVRGLLCQKCNFALGLFRDNVDLIRNAAKYIEDSKKDVG